MKCEDCEVAVPDITKSYYEITKFEHPEMEEVGEVGKDVQIFEEGKVVGMRSAVLLQCPVCRKCVIQ